MTIDTRFSSPDATPTAWGTAREYLTSAEGYWLTTVRSNDALYYTTGPDERKARNIAENAQVYEIAQTTAFGFGKGATFGQTRWRFDQ